MKVQLKTTLTNTMRLLPLALRWRMFAFCALCNAACNPATVDDDITLSINDQPARISLGCSDCPLPAVSVAMEFEQGYGTEEAAVELYQYRVDFDLPEVAKPIPFFAGPIAIQLTSGGHTELRLPLAGSRQLGVLTAEAETLPLDGLATIRFAGYDPRNEPLTLEIDVPLRIETAKREGGQP